MAAEAVDPVATTDLRSVTTCKACGYGLIQALLQQSARERVSPYNEMHPVKWQSERKRLLRERCAQTCEK